MTEDEWYSSTNAKEMLTYMREERPRFFNSQERQLQRFLIGCCWKNEDLLATNGLKEAVKNAERYLEGSVKRQDLDRLDYDAEAEVFGIEYAETLDRIAEVQALIDGIDRLEGVPFEAARKVLVEAAYFAERTLIYPDIHRQRWVMKVFNDKFICADILREHLHPF
ncbi:hypothetical protein [Qipengyuania psychrotolerans]|uniref:Uncharacterized protein n=1 Tax=Qipengyuania psychrotolerans TaxID=2867238 RepID=A0ABX8ZCN2_9SPHN|nr:hypothetical protein [Qipengyuania psychrotolerans]QZD86756.1 hypothetical protein K3166_11185 [Qipengyuania psychrotolerans]